MGIFVRAECPVFGNEIQFDIRQGNRSAGIDRFECEKSSDKIDTRLDYPTSVRLHCRALAGAPCPVLEYNNVDLTAELGKTGRELAQIIYAKGGKDNWQRMHESAPIVVNTDSKQHLEDLSHHVRRYLDDVGVYVVDPKEVSGWDDIFSNENPADFLTHQMGDSIVKIRKQPWGKELPIAAVLPISKDDISGVDSLTIAKVFNTGFYAIGEELYTNEEGKIDALPVFVMDNSVYEKALEVHVDGGNQLVWRLDRTPVLHLD